MNSTSATEPFVFDPSAASGGGSASASQTAGQFWTPPKSSPDNAASLVDQTRNEISQIVREIANACESDRDRAGYIRFLSDRVLRAMAGHGVILWSIDSTASTLQLRAEHRLGIATDSRLDLESKLVHERLLCEIAIEGQPVVVPPTPGAVDPETPANPSELPAAIVPIRIDPAAATPEMLLEVFLESGGTVASQRGCLRFLAQIADLAGEFFRLDQLRGLQRSEAVLRRADRVIDAMHRMPDSGRIEALLVDVIAETLSMPRVALCHLDVNTQTAKVIAVSHVGKIDQLSDAADQLRQSAASPLTAQGDLLLWQAPESQDDATHIRWVAATSSQSFWRIVATGKSSELRPESIAFLRRLLDGTRNAWLAARRWESLPGVRWWGGLWDRRSLPSSTDMTALVRGEWTSDNQEQWTEPAHGAALRKSPSLRRRSIVMTAAAATFVLLALLPIPMLVPAPGVMRPDSMMTYRAMHDAIVDKLHVQHGQSVKRGEVLATLVSRDFQERRTTLVGRRAVLMQRETQWNQSLVTSRGQVGTHADGMSGREVEEEILAIDRQLEVLDRAEADLTIRATRDGRVDAWQLNQRLAGRPLRRGEEVLSVIGDDSVWVVDARIPQEKVPTLTRAIQSDSLIATVSPQWSPTETVDAMDPKWGRVVTDPNDATPAVMVRFTLKTPPVSEVSALAETPARVSIHCGRVALGWFFVEEIVTWCRTMKGLYLG